MTLKLIDRGGVWYVMGTITAPDGIKMRIRETTGVDALGPKPPVAAEKKLSDILAEVMGGARSAPSPTAVLALVVPTINDIAAVYLRKDVTATTRNVIAGFCREFGARRVDSVTALDIQTWVAGKKYQPSSARRELTSVQAMFNHARDLGMRVPAMVLKKPPEGDHRDRWLTTEEQARFIAEASALDPCFGQIVTFLFYTGARCGEAMKLTWGDVSAGGFRFVTRKGKGSKKRSRTVPTVPEAATVIAARRSASPSGAVFLDADGDPWIGAVTGKRHDFYKRWSQACRAAGLKNFKPHDCRHTFATRLIHKGVNLRLVADLLGHTSLNMMSRYAHHEVRHLADAMALLSDVTHCVNVSDTATSAGSAEVVGKTPEKPTKLGFLTIGLSV